MTFWEYLSWPFAKLMLWLYSLTGNYGLTLFLFSLVINLVLAPFMAKSKKSTMRSSRLQPMIQEIQKRHQGNPQQLQKEMQQLYQEEGISPMSGCLWSLLPMFLLFPIYRIVIMPISRMMYASSPRVGESVVEALKTFFTNEMGMEFASSGRSSFYVQIELTNLFHQYKEQALAGLRSAVDSAGSALDLGSLVDMDLSFLGLDLGATPTFSTLWQGPFTWAAIGLFLIPIISALMSWLSMTVATKMNPQPAAGNDQAQNMTKSMNLVMPLMSVWFCFIMPAAMGVYWIANSLFGMARDFILTVIFKKQLAKEDAERAARRSQRELEWEAKRLETERLRAEGKTEQNANTSKKKLQASEKQKSDERKAALDRADRAARRERLGIQEAEKPASQVGNRRYARGRAYVPDRYENPEAAEEATAQAALASEDAPSIDESVPEMGEV
ncbi:MAG: YidC/Oxa1 family membrane protein insertase [Oscillospiraceae bacterium]|nr:YidC/Oxa1 family membrane protein insertase [Oscillospiraceae bacterium]